MRLGYFTMSIVNIYYTINKILNQLHNINIYIFFFSCQVNLAALNQKVDNVKPKYSVFLSSWLETIKFIYVLLLFLIFVHSRMEPK